MKNKILSLLLVFCAATGILLPAAHAGAAEGEAMEAFFSVKAAAGELQSGNRIDVVIYGEPVKPGVEKMASFQFTLEYPEELQLVSLTTALPGHFEKNLENGTAAYSAMSGAGDEVREGGTALAVASFRIDAAEAGEFTVGLGNVEVTRLQDKSGEVESVTPAVIRYTPMLTVSAAEGRPEVQLHNNPAGRLITAVYTERGQMLRSAVSEVEAEAGAQQPDLDLTGGSCVRAFLVDEAFCPLCPAAEKLLP